MTQLLSLLSLLGACTVKITRGGGVRIHAGDFRMYADDCSVCTWKVGDAAMVESTWIHEMIADAVDVATNAAQWTFSSLETSAPFMIDPADIVEPVALFAAMAEAMVEASQEIPRYSQMQRRRVAIVRVAGVV